LVRFSVQNFLSFNERTELDMFASKVEAHPEQIYETGKKPISKILKLALIFGPNASGKSNIVKAIDFARRCVTGKPGFKNLDVNYFKLQEPIVSTACKFELEFYRYGFIADKELYPEEWLYKITSSSLKLVFHRNAIGSERKIEWGDGIFKNDKVKEFYNFVNNSTPDTKLLLKDLRQRKLDFCKDVYEWFDKLVIIYPTTKRGDVVQIFRSVDLQQLYRETLMSCYTGIDDIVFVESNINDVDLQIPEPILNDMLKKAPQTDDTLVLLNLPKGRYILSFKNSKKTLYKLSLKHHIPNSNKEVLFDFLEESDGTMRLFDLIPLLGDVRNDRIIIVDELDRSLHPHLTKHIIKSCLSNGDKNESQLIATSHDVNLLDPDLIRRDAVWFVKKNQLMGTDLYSLEEFKTRNDKDLRTAYLEGFYGATPYIFSE
jgi:AAA15 family ATPase/GTPase